MPHAVLSKKATGFYNTRCPQCEILPFTPACSPRPVLSPMPLPPNPSPPFTMCAPFSTLFLFWKPKGQEINIGSWSYRIPQATSSPPQLYQSALFLSHPPHLVHLSIYPEQIVEPGQSFQENISPFVRILIASCDEEENGLVQVEVQVPGKIKGRGGREPGVPEQASPEASDMEAHLHHFLPLKFTDLPKH